MHDGFFWQDTLDQLRCQLSTCPFHVVTDGRSSWLTCTFKANINEINAMPGMSHDMTSACACNVGAEGAWALRR